MFSMHYVWVVKGYGNILAGLQWINVDVPAQLVSGFLGLKRLAKTGQRPIQAGFAVADQGELSPVTVCPAGDDRGQGAPDVQREIFK